MVQLSQDYLKWIKFADAALDTHRLVCHTQECDVHKSASSWNIWPKIQSRCRGAWKMCHAPKKDCFHDFESTCIGWANPFLAALPLAERWHSQIAFSPQSVKWKLHHGSTRMRVSRDGSKTPRVLEERVKRRTLAHKSRHVKFFRYARRRPEVICQRAATLAIHNACCCGIVNLNSRFFVLYADAVSIASEAFLLTFAEWPRNCMTAWPAMVCIAPTWRICFKYHWSRKQTLYNVITLNSICSGKVPSPLLGKIVRVHGHFEHDNTTFKPSWSFAFTLTL